MVVAIPTPVEIPCGYCDRKFHKENDKNDVAALVDHWECEPKGCYSLNYTS